MLTSAPMVMHSPRLSQRPRVSMSLLKEIIDEAVAKDGDVARLLRLCLVLASRLKHGPLKEWVRSELEGYTADAVLPAYRILRAYNRGHFNGFGWNGTLEIPLSVLPESLRSHYASSPFRGSVAECVELVSKAGPDSSLRQPWPVNLAVTYASKLARDGQCTSAWIEISAAEMVALLDQVKTKVISFALEIEEADPSAGEILGPTGKPKLGEDQVTQIFNTTINGNTVQNVAVGSGETQQSAISGIQAGDLGSLFRALNSLGVSEQRIQTLDAALKEDQADGETGIGSRAKSWLADLALKASEQVAMKGVDSLVTLCAQALSLYFAVPLIA